MTIHRAVWKDGKEESPRRVELIPQHTGLLWGFGVEADSDESTICALVEKPDGGFVTVSANLVVLDHPTLSGQ
jgi:hypothetical protein